MSGKSSSRAGAYTRNVANNARRDVQNLYKTDEKMNPGNVCFVEFWCGPTSSIGCTAAELGCYAVRICKGDCSASDWNLNLQSGVVCNVYLDLNSRSGRRAAYRILDEILSHRGIRRVVCVTSPECPMHCQW